MPTITTVDATWDTGVQMDASELRRADSAMFLGDGTNNGVRGGIVRHGDTSLAVTVNGSDQVTVQSGAFVIPAATGLGVYRGSLGAATSAVALTARNATNPRIDLIAIQVNGTAAVVKTIDGTPSSSPVAPALPAQHIELARVTVPATGGGAVTVDSSWRQYAITTGGMLPVENLNRLPGSGNQKRQKAVALDTGKEYVFDTVWREVGEFNQMTALAAGSTVSGAAITAGQRLQIQACTTTGTTNATGDLQISFPTPFSTGLIAVIPALGDPVNVTAAKYLQPYASDKAFFWVRVYNASGTAQASTNVRVNYVAVGW